MSAQSPPPAADPLLTAAAARVSALPGAVVAKVATWVPQLEQRALTSRDWDAWEPLVRAVVVCAGPRNASVASHLLGTAVSMVMFAKGRKMPLRAELVFRSSTGDAFLKTVPDTSRATVASHVRTLVGAAEQALADPTPAPADPSGDADTAKQARSGEHEPLLADLGEPTARQLTGAGLAGPAAARALGALAAVRALVLAVEPGAMLHQDRFRGRGRSVPYGDREVVALLAAAAAQRSTKRRIHAAAALCLGVGAGITGESAARVRGSDVTQSGGLVLVAVGGRLVPVHAAFAAPVLLAAREAGPGWLLGGGPGRRANRMSELAGGLERTDGHLVRMNSARLGATWLAMHATLGVPLGDLIDAAGWSTAEPLSAVLAYLPRGTTAGRAALGGLTEDEPSAPALAAAPVIGAAVDVQELSA
ncbi:MAG: hypothetical protein ABI661_04895 [Gammaproteobacteria bacterium]